MMTPEKSEGRARTFYTTSKMQTHQATSMQRRAQPAAMRSAAARPALRRSARGQLVVRAAIDKTALVEAYKELLTYIKSRNSACRAEITAIILPSPLISATHTALEEAKHASGSLAPRRQPDHREAGLARQRHVRRVGEGALARGGWRQRQHPLQARDQPRRQRG